MIKLLLAIDQNNGLGFQNDLLFKIPQDLARFKNLTQNNLIVFGRKSYESLPIQPLPNRINVVLTRNKKYNPHPTVFTVDSIEKILNHYSTTKENDKDLFICGGSDVYSAFLPYADEVLLTFIDKAADKVDTYFDRTLLEELFYIGGYEENYCEKNDLNFYYLTYKKK